MSVNPAAALTQQFFAFLFGAAIGSFLNVVIYRVPRGMSIAAPPSHCFACQTPLRAWDNIPVLGYILLRGRCRYCKAPYSPRYAIVELAAGLLAVGSVRHFGLGAEMVLVYLFIALGIVIAFIDLDHWEIYVEFAYAGVVFGIVRGALNDWQNAAVLGPGTGFWQAVKSGWDQHYTGTADAVLGAFAGYAGLWLIGEVFTRLLGREAMGGGDPPLMAMVGAYTGVTALPMALVTGSALGALIGGIAIATGTTVGNRPPESTFDDGWQPGETHIPFGPFLVLGGVVTLFFGDLIHQEAVEPLTRMLLRAAFS